MRIKRILLALPLLLYFFFISFPTTLEHANAGSGDCEGVLRYPDDNTPINGHIKIYPYQRTPLAVVGPSIENPIIVRPINNGMFDFEGLLPINAEGGVSTAPNSAEIFIDPNPDNPTPDRGDDRLSGRGGDFLTILKQYSIDERNKTVCEFIEEIAITKPDDSVSNTAGKYGCFFEGARFGNKGACYLIDESNSSEPLATYSDKGACDDDCGLYILEPVGLGAYACVPTEPGSEEERESATYYVRGGKPDVNYHGSQTCEETLSDLRSGKIKTAPQKGQEQKFSYVDGDCVADTQGIYDSEAECLEIGVPLPTPIPIRPPCPDKEGVSGNLTDDGTCPEFYTGLGTIRTDPQKFIGDIMRIILGFAGGIAVLIIMYAGYKMMMSRGNPEKIEEAKEQITSAIIGIVFIIFSLVILEVIGVDILRLPGFYPTSPPAQEKPGGIVPTPKGGASRIPLLPTNVPKCGTALNPPCTRTRSGQPECGEHNGVQLVIRGGACQFPSSEQNSGRVPTPRGGAPRTAVVPTNTPNCGAKYQSPCTQTMTGQPECNDGLQIIKDACNDDTPWCQEAPINLFGLRCPKDPDNCGELGNAPCTNRARFDGAACKDGLVRQEDICKEPAPTSAPLPPPPAPRISPTQSQTFWERYARAWLGNGNRPSPAASTPTPCTIANAKWVTEDNPVSEGVQVGLFVTGSGTCRGKNVEFTIKQDVSSGGDEDAVEQPTSAVFDASNNASVFWPAEWRERCGIDTNPFDGFGGVCDSKYYFNATVTENGSTMESSNPKNLEVVETSP